MSVYTQLINAPLPGQQRHLILLDNGRSALRTSPLRDSLRCIRCGACLNACPAFREMGGHAYGSVYPGPIGSVISPGLFGASFSEMAYACSLCGACEEVCPVKIPLPNLLVRVRAGQLPQPAQPGAPLPAALKAGISAFAWFATHPRWFALAQKVAGLLTQGRILSLPPQTGWGLSRDIATPAAQPFRERFQKAKEESRNSRVENGDLRVGNRDSDSEQPTTKNESPITNNQSLIQRFASELQAVSAELIRTSAAGLPAALQTWLTQNDIRTVYAGDEIALPSGITRHNQPDAQAGISAALLGIAETGSLLLQESADSPLAASLLPPIHLAILPASQLFTTLEQALAHPQTRLAPALSLVTGPSRTADIEMTLTIGVHGPGRLVVFLLEEE
jgi:L-lactate dehydrogenase complex protein LldF